MMREEQSYWLAWARIRGIGPHRLKRLHQHFGSLSIAWMADAPALQAVEGIGEQLSVTIEQERQQLDPDRIREEVGLANIPFFTPADPDYPPLLWELPDPPPLLYCLGTQRPWLRTVAMVGTRHPTPYGRRWGETLAQELAKAGFVVVSGLAAGIDAVCHQGALKGGGSTVAVVGTGVDVVYPAKHQGLYQQILQQGCVLSEFPPGTQPAKENFPRRNRVIAGLCQHTLVLEAPIRSGALITAYLANDYNRNVWALPGTIDTEAARGCLNLIRTGAGLILGVDELLSELGVATALTDPQPGGQDRSPQPDPVMPPLSGSQLTIWQALTDEPISIDTLAQQTQLEIQTLSSELLMMELEGWTVQVSGLRYRRVSP